MNIVPIWALLFLFFNFVPTVCPMCPIPGHLGIHRVDNNQQGDIMEIRVEQEYRINLQPLVDAYGTGKEIYSGLQVVEAGVRGFDGKLNEGQKSLQLVNYDEFEHYVSCDGSIVEVLDIYDDGRVELRDVYDQTEFTLDIDDALLALSEL